MDDAATTELGPPNIELEDLQMWVHGRQFPNMQDYWDGNWLRVTARCAGAGASVSVTGPIIHLSELQRWQSESKQLRDTLKGEAKLTCIEPALAVSLKALTLGHVAMEVSITPDHMNQRHWFQFEIDQSYLDALLAQFESILGKYPLRGSP